MRKNNNQKLNTRHGIYNTIEQIFKNNPFKVYATGTILKLIGSRIRKSQKPEVVKNIKEMVSKGIIEQVKSGEFRFNSKNMKEAFGTIVTITPTAGYVEVTELEEDVIVERTDMLNSLIGDEVKMFIYEARGGRYKGVIKEITKRSEKRYVGVIDIKDDFAFVICNSRDMRYDIFIPKKDIANAQNGDMVVTEIVEFLPTQPNPVGKIIKSLGKAGTNNAEIHAILEEFSLPYEFDKDVIDASERIPETISAEDIKNRRDFREITTFTIDPFDAKDFDDALSIRTVGENKWEIGIHIADVTHYIKDGSPLERDAKERATSVYLVDRVVPMLPERLSNGVCSLRPNEDKLCFSVVVTMDENANILDRWYGRTVINSNKRFAYEDAQKLIEGEEGELKEEVLTLHKLATILRTNRFKHGSIGFERDEFKFKLDEEGKPLGVYQKVSKESNHLIEEFMLLANKCVAEYIALSEKPNRTFVYRIHTEPNSEKYNDLVRFVSRFGFKLRLSSDNKVISEEINTLLSEVKGQKTETLISTLALRAMAKAVYSTVNVGHYGLGFPNYTHFTSPIRRYPDMMVHRLLQRYLDAGASASQEYYEDLCDHSSKREQRAAEAERASIKYKMAEFLADKIGVQFAGTISGVTDKGIYVELEETKIEGMVSVYTMTDDLYTFDAENYRMVGRSNRESLMLGDKVKVEVLRVDMQRKLIDYSLISHTDLETGEEYFFETDK